MLKKGRLFSLFIIMGIVPLILMTVFSYFNTSGIINDKVNNSIRDNIKIMSRLVDSSMNSFESISSFVANDDDVKTILMKNDYLNYDEKFNDIQKIYRITNLVLATQKLDIPIYITGKNSLSYYTNMDFFPSIYQDLNSDIFKEADKNALLKKPYIYVHRRVDGKYRKDIVIGIVDQIVDIQSDKVIGYVSLDVYDDYFNDIFNSVKAYKDDDIYILDKSGYIITDKYYKNKTGFRFDDKYVNTILSNKSGTFNCSIDGRDYIAYFDTVEKTGFKVVETIPKSIIYSDRVNIVKFFIIMLVLFAAGAVWVSYMLSKYISNPVNKLAELMSSVEKGDRTVNFDVRYDDEIGRLGTSFNNMVKEIHRLIDDVYVKKYMLKDAEFEALKAQVNPHFLYNILESINWMARMRHCDDISDMIMTLGKFLRYSISTKGDIVTIAEDMKQVGNYLKLQKMRYGDKFTVKIHIDEEIYDNKILKLLVQPIVENAIVHGIEPKMGNGLIIINGYRDENNICIDIMDDGVGMNNSSKSTGEGLGMNNVDKRIKIHYGEEYGLSVGTQYEMTCVRLTIPYVDITGENE